MEPAMYQSSISALWAEALFVSALQRCDQPSTGQARQAGEPPLSIGIGLNWGPAVLGDVGSEHSMSFTVIGDTVNTASRLQALTRTLETPLVVGHALVNAVEAGSSSIATRLAGQLFDRGEHILRGRTGPVRIWTGSTRD